MTDYTSLQAKVNDLKAKVDSNSISPSYVGALLDDFISIIKSSDQEEDVAAALQNAATALTLARSSSTKADNARATANAAKAVTDTKGAPNGIASLDGEGRIPLSQLPVTAVVALPFDGTVEDVAIYAESPVTSEAIDALNAGNLAVVFDTGCNKFRLRMSGGDAPAIYFSSWIGLVGSGKELPGASEYVNGTIFLNTQNDAYYTRPDSVSALRLLGSVSEFEKEFRRNGALTGGVTVEHQANSVKVCIPKVAEDGSHSTEDAVIGAVGVNAGLMLPKHVAAIEKSTEDIEKLIGEIDTLLGEGASSAIDTFNEVEKFLAGVTDSETLTGLLTALKTELQASINGKVDKVTGKGLSANDYTDADRTKLGALPTNEQFGIVGYVSKLNGQFTVESVYRSSELLPLNHNYDLVFVAKALNNAASVSFYTANGTWISSVQKTTTAESTIPKSEFPANAVFVRFTAVAAEISSCYYKNGPSIESREGAVSEAIQAAKMALFIDQWNAACGSYGKYNPANAPDAQHPFYLNTLWLTYAEAIKIAEQKPSWGTRQTDFLWRNIKTNIPQLIGAVASAYGNCFSNIEVVNLKYLSPTSMGTCFTGNDNKSVLNFNAYMLESASGCFNAPNLEVLEISNLKISLDLSKCPLINLASWQGLVTNAVNTAPITVTVHPDVYAKLTGDTTNAAAAALSADELAQWQSLVSAAAAKNISFATV